jgi:hypothetical protein
MLPSSHRRSIYCFADAIIKASISLSPHTTPRFKTYALLLNPNHVSQGLDGSAIPFRISYFFASMITEMLSSVFGVECSSYRVNLVLDTVV